MNKQPHLPYWSPSMLDGQYVQAETSGSGTVDVAVSATLDALPIRVRHRLRVGDRVPGLVGWRIAHIDTGGVTLTRAQTWKWGRSRIRP